MSRGKCGCGRAGAGRSGAGQAGADEQVRETGAEDRVRTLSFALCLSVVLVASCTSGPGPTDDRGYAAQIETSRASKDAMFKSGAESPIPPEKRAAFPGLAYYPIDAAYRVPAHLKRDATASPVIIEMDTSQLQRRKMRRVGVL